MILLLCSYIILYFKFRWKLHAKRSKYFGKNVQVLQRILMPINELKI